MFDTSCPFQPSSAAGGPSAEISQVPMRTYSLDQLQQQLLFLQENSSTPLQVVLTVVLNLSEQREDTVAYAC